MARLDVPGLKIEWCENGEYILPDSSNILRFDLVVVDPRKLIGWYIRQEWRSLGWRERAMSLLAWAIIALKEKRGRLWA